MIARFCPAFLCGFALCIASPALAADVLFVNFDEDADGIPLTDGAVINSAYAAVGVSLSATGPGNCSPTPDIFARSIPFAFGSSPNVVSTCPTSHGPDISEVGQGMVRADIARPANWICIDVHAFDANDQAVMRAYDVSGQPIDEVFSTPGASEKLCVLGCGIQRVEFSGTGSNAMLFDNLTVAFENRVLIDFDADTEDSPLAHGTVVDSTYSSWGVTFQADPVPESCGIDDHVLAHSNQPHSFGSSPNVVTTCHSGAASDISENTNGIVHARFDRPACRACIDVHVSDGSYQAILRGYDAGEAVVATAESTPGAIETICVSAPEIWGVTFSGKGNGYARFDNLEVLFPVNLVASPSPAARERLVLRSVFPNPASRGVRVALTLATAEPARVQIVDVSGRILASKRIVDQRPGDHLISLDPGRSTARGVYFVRLVQGAASKTSKVVFLP